jgi:hypothetical protein
MPLFVRLSQNEKFAFLNYTGTDYIRDNDPHPNSPYTKQPGGQPVSPTVEYWISEIEQDVAVVDTEYITDTHNNTYFKIVGSRPSNIKKR